MPASLKISFFGSSLVSAYWNGAATYSRGLIRALSEKGHLLADHTYTQRADQLEGLLAGKRSEVTA